MKVFIAYSGEYDDRRAIGVYADEQHAKAVSLEANKTAKLWHMPGGPDIEEFELDELIIDVNDAQLIQTQYQMIANPQEHPNWRERTIYPDGRVVTVDTGVSIDQPMPSPDSVWNTAEETSRDCPLCGAPPRFCECPKQ